MITDGIQLTANLSKTADICILGGGAAGVTCGLTLAQHGRSVIILESGGMEWDAGIQELSNGRNSGLPYLPANELCFRALGGNTNRWGSWCRPFDDLDFEERSWVAESGWPISRKELDPYYERSHSWCKLREYQYTPDALLAGFTDPSLQVVNLGSDIMTSLWQFRKPPVRFGPDHIETLSKSSNIEVILNSSAFEIVTNEAGTAVTQVRAGGLNGNHLTILAKHFILALGGTENPRLLLASNRVQKQGLGNDHDVVGRYFMDNPHLHEVGLIMFSDLSAYPGLYHTDSQYTSNVVGAFCASPEFQRRERILGCSVTVRPSTRIFTNAAASKGFLETIEALIDDVQEGPSRILDKVRRRLGRKRKPGGRERVVAISTRSEQSPNRNSRIVLSPEKDPLGLPRIELQWRLQGIDARTIHVTHERIARALGETGKGRFRMETEKTYPVDNQNWTPHGSYSGITGGWHYMGTTRMHDDPSRGVVDKNCKVHSLDNLYVAGSSVFPTSGYTNPTLTIVALSIRLADRLDSVLKA